MRILQVYKHEGACHTRDLGKDGHGFKETAYEFLYLIILAQWRTEGGRGEFGCIQPPPPKI
jgi:hypothetical protein